MHPRTLTLTLLASALALGAGCVGTDDGSQGLPGSDDGAGDEPSTQWTTATASGTVEGAGSPAGGVSQGDTAASWTVPENTRLMYLNITTEGGDLDYQYGPDCQTDPAVSCEYNGSTQDGEAMERVAAPTPGSWEIYFFLQTDAGEVDWSFTADMGVEPS